MTLCGLIFGHDISLCKFKLRKVSLFSSTLWYPYDCWTWLRPGQFGPRTMCCEPIPKLWRNPPSCLDTHAKLDDWHWPMSKHSWCIRYACWLLSPVITDYQPLTLIGHQLLTSGWYWPKTSPIMVAPLGCPLTSPSPTQRQELRWLHHVQKGKAKLWLCPADLGRSQGMHAVPNCTLPAPSTLSCCQ